MSPGAKCHEAGGGGEGLVLQVDDVTEPQNEMKEREHDGKLLIILHSRVIYDR